MKRRSAAAYSRGFTLTEIMVASVLAIFLVGLLAQLYLSNKRTHRWQQGIARIQENGRYAVHILDSHIRQAGFIGCPSLEGDFVVASASGNPGIGAQNSLQGNTSNDSAWLASLPSRLRKQVAADSDVITIRKVEPQLTSLTQTMRDQTHLQVTDNNKLKAGETVLVANCSEAETFQVAKVSEHTGQGAQDLVSHTPLTQHYAKDATLSPLIEESYLVANTGRKNHNAHPIYALYRLAENQRKTELVSGVKQMKVSYGVGDNNAAPQLHNAAWVDKHHAWRQVRSVKVALLLDSVEAVGNKAHSYTFAGQGYVPVDGRLYREWDTYIQLREHA